jgi:hypothetical protein
MDDDELHEAIVQGSILVEFPSSYITIIESNS